MITFYSGTPGSGKSLHMAKEIYSALTFKKRAVIGNFPLDYNVITNNGKKKAAQYYYVPNEELTPDYLYNYALENHELGKEKQTLVCIDECQLLFNPREHTKKDRLPWIRFFTEHRRLGFDFILVSQMDSLVDRQIRGLFEYEVKHRKLNNFGGFVLLPFQTFVAITYWYPIREKLERSVFRYKKFYGQMYDSGVIFGGRMKELLDEREKQQEFHVLTGSGTP